MTLVDTLPGNQPCPRSCSASVDPLTLPSHLKWHADQDATILALRTKLASLGVTL